MVTRRTATRKAATTRKAAPASKPAATTKARTTTRKAATPAAAPAKPVRDVTEYAEKAPTPYHKAFAKWIVEEVGYTPTNRKDFLAGVSIATAARPAFTESEWLANWREETGENKRGPKPKNAPAAPARGRKAAPAPVDEVDEDDTEEFDRDGLSEELEELTVVKLKQRAKAEYEATTDDLRGLDKEELVEWILDAAEEAFDAEESEEDDEDESDEEDDEDAEDDEEDEDDTEEEEAPEPPARGRRRAAAPKAAPAKGARARSPKASAEDDKFLF